MDTPQVFGGALRGATVGKGHTIRLRDTLRKYPAHERAPAVHGGQLVAQPQIAHPLPPRHRLDLGVEGLGLAHARPPGDDDKVRRLESRRLEVELLEPGRDASDVLLPLVQPLDVLEGVLEDLADGERAPLEAPLGEAEDAALGVVHERLDVLLRVEGLRDDLGRGVDELAQDGHVPHDLRVGMQVGRDRRLLDQERQRRRPAHELELIAPAELLLERQHVDRLAPVEEAEHDVVHRPVGLGVEIGGPQDLDDARERLAPFQQHGAEHRALGVQVVRRDLRRDFDGAHRRVSPRVDIIRSDVERCAPIGSRKIVAERRGGEQTVDTRWVSRADDVQTGRDRAPPRARVATRGRC